MSSAAPASAVPDADPAYPVVSLVNLLSGPAADGADMDQGTYQAVAGFLAAPERVFAAHPELLDPAQFQGPEGREKALALIDDALDGALHSRPTLLGSNITGAGNTHFMPDWNHDGTFGNPPDYDIDNTATNAVGPFRYPCIGAEGSVRYQTTSGACVSGEQVGATFRLGDARRLRFINSRGLRLSATVWVPRVQGRTKSPGVVFAGGIASRQEDYYAYAMSLARAGYVAMTFDQSGQGTSQGKILDTTGQGLDVADCPTPNPCLDLHDATRWFTGAPIAALETSGSPRLSPGSRPAYLPEGDNRRNPALGRIDTTRIGIMGHSMGSISTLSYLHYLPSGRGFDGNPLPRVRAAVAMSALTPGSAAAPVQAQTGDYDLPGPGLGEHRSFVSDGPLGQKAWYDDLRATKEGSGAIQSLTFESASHIDQTNTPYVPHTTWTLGLSIAYALDWFGCHLRGDPGACRGAIKPRPHLSRSVASEYDPDGPAGPSPSRCMTIPDRATISNPRSLSAALTGRAPYDCTP